MPSARSRTSRGNEGSDREPGAAKTRKKGQQRAPSPATEELATQLAQLGLAPKDVPGDGNCLFRSLADQMPGTNHANLRAVTVEHMRNSPELYSPFIDVDVDVRIGKKGLKGGEEERTASGYAAYVTRMARDGVYATNLELVAFSRRHGRDVVVHQAGQAPWVVHCDGEKKGPPLHVVYLNFEHYQSVKRLGNGDPEVEMQDNSKQGAKAAKNTYHEQDFDEEENWGEQEADGEHESVDVLGLVSSYGDGAVPEGSGSPPRKRRSFDESASEERERDRAAKSRVSPVSEEPAAEKSKAASKDQKRPSKQQLKELRKKAQKAAALEKKRAKDAPSAGGDWKASGKGAGSDVDAVVGGVKAVVI